MSEAAAPEILCRLNEIEDGEAKGFVLGAGSEARDIFVVRDGVRVFGYVNSCPHIGTPLDWVPDQFMSADGSHIICATHGALFQIEDGLCVGGPCQGERLASVEVAVDGRGRIVLVSP